MGVTIPGQWLQSTWDNKVKRMVQLYASPDRDQYPLLDIHLNETLSKDKLNMRLVFTATLGVDVPPDDEQLRAAFIELVKSKVKEVYAPAVMLSKRTPEFKLTLTSRDGGQKELHLFAEHGGNSGE